MQDSEALNHIASRVDEIRDLATKNATQMTTLIGNGQKGRIRILEENVEALNSHKDKATGYIAALIGVATILSVVGHWLVDAVMKVQK
jgi:hypothetical protein